MRGFTYSVLLACHNDDMTSPSNNATAEPSEITPMIAPTKLNNNQAPTANIATAVPRIR